MQNSFHDFGNPNTNSSYALEFALEEAAIKISGFEAEVQEKDTRIKDLEEELGRAKEFIKQLEASNDALKRQLRAREKSPIPSSGSAVHLNSGSDDLAIIGKSKQETSTTTSIQPSPSTYKSTPSTLTPTRIPHSSSTLSTTKINSTSTSAVKRAREVGSTSTTTQRIVSEIKPIRNPSQRPTIASKSKTTQSRLLIPKSTGSSSDASPSLSSSSSTNSRSSNIQNRHLSNPSNLTEDELLARRLQQEEFANYQSRATTNFDELISNNLGGNYNRPSFSNVRANPLSSSIQNFTGEETYEELLRLDESNIKVGVNKDLLTHLPITIFNNNQHSFEDNSCTFCMEEYQNGEQLRRLPCLHIFHKDCVDKWLEENHTCPCCKYDLNG